MLFAWRQQRADSAAVLHRGVVLCVGAHGAELPCLSSSTAWNRLMEPKPACRRETPAPPETGVCWILTSPVSTVTCENGLFLSGTQVCLCTTERLLPFLFVFRLTDHTYSGERLTCNGLSVELSRCPVPLTGTTGTPARTSSFSLCSCSQASANTRDPGVQEAEAPCCECVAICNVVL